MCAIPIGTCSFRQCFWWCEVLELAPTNWERRSPIPRQILHAASPCNELHRKSSKPLASHLTRSFDAAVSFQCSAVVFGTCSLSRTSVSVTRFRDCCLSDSVLAAFLARVPGTPGIHDMAHSVQCQDGSQRSGASIGGTRMPLASSHGFWSH